MLNFLPKHKDLVYHRFPFCFFQWHWERQQQQNMKQFWKPLTVGLHLDSPFQFLLPTHHSAQVEMFVLKTHRAQGQRGLGALAPHIPVQRAVYQGSPRERWGLTVPDITGQHDWVANLSSNLGSRRDLNSKHFLWWGEKNKTKIKFFHQISIYSLFSLTSF